MTKSSLRRSSAATPYWPATAVAPLWRGVVAGSAGMAANHAPACGHAWERSSARSLGRMAGSKTRSWKEVWSAKAASLGQPLAQTPGSPRTSCGGAGHASHPGRCPHPCSSRWMPAAAAAWRLGAAAWLPASSFCRQRPTASGHRCCSKLQHRQCVRPFRPVGCRRDAFRMQKAQTAKGGWKEGNVPGWMLRSPSISLSAAQHVLHRLPDRIVMRTCVLGDRSRRNSAQQVLSAGAAQKRSSSQAHCRSGS